MYSTNQHSTHVSGQQAPVTGIPVTSSNQQYYPVTENYHHLTPAGTGKVPWSTGLCDCCSHVPNCCMTCWCPCITFGQIAEIVDQGSSSCGLSGAMYALLGWVTGCACLYSCFYRSKMRSQYMLEDSPCADCCVHFWCHTCALCQEYRELKNRGFNMSLGWHGSMERMQSREMPTAPVVDSGMKR